ncbi:hypothetical protein A7K94_0204105 [Modestobacter sp. VKM Ac-2676]|nr:hypothetical protein A7K94_0204105 [Modestobacter sp. VKM Ac-2676]
MTTPGSGSPQSPEQYPTGPQGWGQQPPAGQPHGDGAQASGAPAAPGSSGKVKAVIGGLVALVVVLGALSFFLSGGAPEVGDCIQAEEGGSFSTVDCGSDDAAFRVVGTDEDMTKPEFDADPDTCAAFPNAEAALWSGADENEPGDVYCAEAV